MQSRDEVARAVAERHKLKEGWTPGPWIVDAEDSDVYQVASDEILASVYPMKRDGQRDSWKPNARLIAAAPKLLDELIDSELRIQELREALRNSAKLLGQLYGEIAEDAVEAGNQRISKWPELVRDEALLSEEKKP